ncbi:MAG: ribosome small subunit-dependent GTPase A [Bacteroidota bacterium]
MQSSTPMLHGKVIQSTGAWYQVKSHDGMVYPCQLRGKLRLQKLRLTNPVVVGDEVAFTPGQAQAPGVIHTVMPRKNYLIRQATHKKTHGQLLAANLDQAMLIVAAVDIPLAFIDRFLVVAAAFDIPPALVFNKIDLLDSQHRTALATTQALYDKLGYTTLAVSAHTQANIKDFTQLLADKVSLLSGHSGVGKSTLLNTIAPTVSQAVAPVDAAGQRGQHTTTYAALFEVAPNTFVMDTPGIQTLVPYALEKQALSHYFPEMRSLAASCKFYNCTHLHEPNCAVRQALQEGAIAASRYQSYEGIMNDEL